MLLQVAVERHGALDPNHDREDLPERGAMGIARTQKTPGLKHQITCRITKWIARQKKTTRDY